jgi:hypothetical protein
MGDEERNNAMSEDLRYNWLSMLSRWRKLLAAFIVLWAMMDLTVPGVCQSDDLETSLASALAVMHTAAPAAGVSGVSNTPSDNNPDRPGPEDCFCCSSHIAPTSVFHVTVLYSFLAFQQPYSLGSPHDFSPFFYHPPKA